ncbi:S-adenosyl-L-methionine-dependent methyltransferase [Jaminaea rosea]|uniref:S-adenosyl-L-methionine-dependent methyltransferase n=1 Tax=Jaminaea rosea TaxID=1569628 RepID=A0A316ULG3_9BASI|nr:S-adenosyl-L-methionine-dependent methyltransferase [Jaminaea rosea]PWN26126.1 S-adenosyl-L-methionine-dependent methyltransferase [Jaminaea rosea]
MSSHFYAHSAHLLLLALERRSSLKSIVARECPLSSASSSHSSSSSFSQSRTYTLAEQKRYLATLINLLAWRGPLEIVVVQSGVEGEKELGKALGQAWKRYEGSGSTKQKHKQTAACHALLLLLVHDMLCSRTKRIAASPAWPPHRALLPHRARLQAELVRLQVAKGKGRMEELRSDWREEVEGDKWVRGRWVRVNARNASMNEMLDWLRSRGYSQAQGDSFPESGRQFLVPSRGSHPENLLLLPLSATPDLLSSALYKEGKVILQDAASCWPAHLLLHNSATPPMHVLDATAAPGNKTSHLSALLSSRPSSSSPQAARITALERDPQRFRTLTAQLKRFACLRPGAGMVTPLQADFLSLDPSSSNPSAREVALRDVTHMLLDPSCSGSGITGRLDWLTATATEEQDEGETEVDEAHEEGMGGGEGEGEGESGRLERLAALQLNMILHAWRSYPSLERVVYSTCSVHRIEDEEVVRKALASPEARGRTARGREYKWALAERRECLPGWPWRGEEGKGEEAERMMRAYPAGEIEDACEGEGKRIHLLRTNGFFAACFVKRWEDEERGTKVSLNERGESRNAEEGEQGGSTSTSSTTAAERKKRKRLRQKASREAKRARGEGEGEGGEPRGEESEEEEEQEEWKGCAD